MAVAEGDDHVAVGTGSQYLKVFISLPTLPMFRDLV